MNTDPSYENADWLKPISYNFLIWTASQDDKQQQQQLQQYHLVKQLRNKSHLLLLVMTTNRMNQNALHIHWTAHYSPTVSTDVNIIQFKAT